jgi:hypothetical protein
MMEVERIKYERTGGFAGMRFAADIEPGNLPEEQARTLLDLLDDMDFGELPEQLMDEMSASDQYTYTITVETKKWEHTVTTGDSSASEQMQQLLELLNGLARKQMRKQ